jgi:hypothetical protein
MLDEATIQNNKEVFLELIGKIDREGSDIPLLIKQLTSSDFFVAPASTKWHGAYEGGLCDHCLNVYFNLKRMIENKGLEEKYSETSLIIVALLHDLSKMNFYEKSVRNKKVYSNGGSKHDELGKFDWVSVPSYVIKDASDRFVFANHGQTAEFMARKFVPLTVDESVAIINHMGGFDSGAAIDNNLSDIYNKYPLAAVLHAADFISSYIDEGF